MSEARGHPSSQWLFSMPKDLTVFWGSLGFAAVSAYVIADTINVRNTFLYLVFIKILIDTGHIFWTIPPLLFNKKEAMTNRWLGLYRPAVLCLSTLLLFNLNRPLFYHILAYIALHHIIAQQYGWVALLNRRNGKEKYFRWIDKLFLWALVLYPVLYWHSDARSYSARFFRPNDFFRIPDLWAQNFELVYWPIIAAYMAYTLLLWRRGVTPVWPKILILTSTWIWFYCGIVLAQNNFHFWPISMVIIHGLAYMFFIHQNFQSSSPANALKPQFLKGFKASLVGKNFFLSYLSFAMVLAVIYRFTMSQGMESSGRVFILEPLMWCLTLLHYYFDGIFWKKNVF